MQPQAVSLRASIASAALLLFVLVGPPPARAEFVTFESGQVRPLALSPDGERLFALNTPDDRLEIFAVAVDGSLTREASVPVGLEPVAVAARSDSEVWVVNHLSDSVSIVDVASSPPRVVRTLLVGDEPRDVVFAGTPSGGVFPRAFITTARRGQNLPASPWIRSSRRKACPARWSSCSTRRTSAAPSAERRRLWSSSSGTRPARSPRRRTGAPSTPRSSTRGTRRRRSRKASSAMAAAPPLQHGRRH